jgi:hypothetical protein
MAKPPMHVDRFRGRLDRFLFAPADAGAAAVMRVALAMMIGWSFWSRGLSPKWPITMISGSTAWYDSVFLTPWYAVVVAILIASFGLGFRPRICGLLLVVLLFPLLSLTRGQQSRVVLLFTLLSFSLLRSDARWSVPTWLGLATPQRSAGPMWPVRLIQLQLSIIYAVNALVKATPHYLNGDVLIGLSQMLPNFMVDLSDGYLHIGPIAFPVAIAGVATVVVESYLAIGFWFPRLRWLTAAIGVLFHLILQQVVSIFMLDYVSMFLYLAFLLPWHGADQGNEDHVQRTLTIGRNTWKMA